VTKKDAYADNWVIHPSSGHQPDFAALNRGRHLCSAGRPSGWALAHILVNFVLVFYFVMSCDCQLIVKENDDDDDDDEL